MSERNVRFEWQWRGADLACLCALTALALLALALRWPGRQSCPTGVPSVDRLRLLQIAQRLDPNVESAASLRRLPMIGPARARAIVAYRQAAASQPAFRTPDDLEAVSGIGPAVIYRARPYLWPGQALLDGEADR